MGAWNNHMWGFLPLVLGYLTHQINRVQNISTILGSVLYVDFPTSEAWEPTVLYLGERV